MRFFGIWLRGARGDRRAFRILCWLLAAVVVALLAYRVLVLSFQKAFDTDEFEHIQDVWLLSRNLTIYRDFFEHHPPLLYLYLLPLPGMFLEARLLFAASIAMIPFSAGIVLMVYLLASKIRGRLSGFFASLLLSTVIVYQQKSIEIRPDVPAIFFLLLALLLVVPAEGHPRRLFAAGVAYGVSLLCTPKLMFASPAFVIALFWPGRKPLFQWTGLARLALGLSLPCAVVATYLLWHGSLKEAFFFNVTFNAAVPFTDRWNILNLFFGRSLLDNWAFWTLSCCALLLGGVRVFRTGSRNAARRRGEAIVVAAAFGLRAGMLSIPVPLRQYIASFCAVLAIVAGIFAAGLAFRIMRLLRTTGASLVSGIAFTALLLHPMPALMQDRLTSNQQQLEVLRYVWSVVPPDQTVFDCWTGLGVFRMPAFFYHFIGPEVLAALERLDRKTLRSDLLNALEEKRPIAIPSGPMLFRLPYGTLDFITRNYHIDRYGVLFLRNQPGQ